MCKGVMCGLCVGYVYACSGCAVQVICVGGCAVGDVYVNKCAGERVQFQRQVPNTEYKCHFLNGSKQNPYNIIIKASSHNDRHTSDMGE